MVSLPLSKRIVAFVAPQSKRIVAFVTSMLLLWRVVTTEANAGDVVGSVTRLRARARLIGRETWTQPANVHRRDGRAAAVAGR